MARRDSAVADVENPEVEVVDESEVETVEATTEGEKPAKEKKGPKRGSLPEGYVTPIGLAKELSKSYKDADGNDVFYHTDKNGGHEVRPQMVYSYKNNAPQGDPFPEETVKDSEDIERSALKLADGLAWWLRKNERVAGKRANAAEKASKKAANAAKKETTEEAEGDESTVAEALEAE
jgi:hypothetical protein